MIEIGIFAAKSFIILFAILAVIITIAVIAARASHKPDLEVDSVHKDLKRTGFLLKAVTYNKEEFKKEKKKFKADAKKDKKSQGGKIFVINFKGDMMANEVENLRQEITAILQIATTEDEVVVKLESPGGVVHGYGLAASQLQRIRSRNIKLTICVDKVAASGGYMMACVGNQILAAPFAILGSIGVVAQLPNFYRILKKNDVDYKEYTAGEYKRTVTMLGEITSKGEQKFLEQLEDTHQLFKGFVGEFRPQLDMSKVATGEYWFGKRALALGLADGLMTSDDYLLTAFQKETPIYEIKFNKKKPLSEKLANILGNALTKSFNKIFDRVQQQQFF